MAKKLIFNFDEEDLKLPKAKDDMNTDEKFRFMIGILMNHFGEAFKILSESGFELHDIKYAMFLLTLPQCFTNTEQREYDLLLVASKQIVNQGKTDSGISESLDKMWKDFIVQLREKKSLHDKFVENMINRIFPEDHMIREKARTRARIAVETRSINEAAFYVEYCKLKTSEYDESIYDRVLKMLETSVNRNTAKFKKTYDEKIDALKLDYNTIENSTDKLNHLLKVEKIIRAYVDGTPRTVKEILSTVNEFEKKMLSAATKKTQKTKTKKETKNIPVPTPESLKADQMKKDLANMIENLI